MRHLVEYSSQTANNSAASQPVSKKTARKYLALVTLAAIILWMR